MNAEQEAKAKEIFDILLSAGYFRCRIPSISTFDKLLGGIAWCITLSNFDIDVHFSDDMNMGQKIKLSEKVVSSLQKMGCPYQIQPYQIQGLDLKNIFPIVQWLINFVLETRDVRQNFNKSMASYKGNAVYGVEKESQPVTSHIIQKQNMKDRRVTKNSKIESYKIRDPLRVYSSLMEYDDKTAVRTYNRLSLYLAVEEKRKENEKDAAAGKDVTTKPATKKAEEKHVFGGKDKSKDKEAEQFENLFIPSGDGAEDVKPEALEFVDVRRGRSGSVSGQELYKIVVENRNTIMKGMQNQQKDDEEEEMASMLRQENEFFEDQKATMKRQIDRLEEKKIVRGEELQNLIAVVEEVEHKHTQIKQMNTELSETADIIEKKIQAIKNRITPTQFANLEELNKKKEELKAEKSTLKKTVKTQMAKVEEEKQEIEEAWPVYSEPISEDILNEYNIKKAKYDNRYAEFAKLNQENAVLQRKIEGYTSSIETAQYYKRFIELYERINFEMELYRDYYVKFNNNQDIKAALMQQNDLMKSFKEGLFNLGTSSKKKEGFLKDLGEALKGLQENLRRSSEILAKTKTQRDKNAELYNQLVNQERQYYSYLRELQLEYERNDKLTEALSAMQ